MRAQSCALMLCVFTSCLGAVFERRGGGGACPAGARCAPLSHCPSAALAASGRPGSCASAARELSVCCAEDSALASLSSPNYRLRRAPNSPTVPPSLLPGVASGPKPTPRAAPKPTPKPTPKPSRATGPSPRPQPSQPTPTPHGTTTPPPSKPTTPPVTTTNAPSRTSPSERACQDYLRYNDQPYLQNMNDYGIRFVRTRRAPALLQRNVIGGENAKVAEFAFMAAIGSVPENNNSNTSEITWVCGGSLISDRYVLTAAHCITDSLSQKLRPVVIRTGVNRLQQGARQPGDYAIEATVRHPQHQAQLKYFDLALLRTDRPVPVSLSERPVCLATPATRVDVNSTLIVAGWGATDPSGFEMSGDLKKAQLRLVEPAECKKFITETKSLPRGLDDGMVCAAEPNRQADTCNGDSGGPLVARVGGVDTLVGVTSFGGRPCAGRSPGVYARVAPQLQWIESVVWPTR